MPKPTVRRITYALKCWIFFFNPNAGFRLLGHFNPACVLSTLYPTLGCQITQVGYFFNTAFFRVYSSEENNDMRTDHREGTKPLLLKSCIHLCSSALLLKYNYIKRKTHVYLRDRQVQTQYKGKNN